MSHVHARDHRHDSACAWLPEPRCTRTGHRIAWGGIEPRQTRGLPPVLWPFEIAGRIEAVLRRHLARKGKL